ncbi:hypothetical protein HD599_001642 [Conyzicola lurida]|uniref:Uncharacterized protein n=1 Tax=Conyzicola lurida TaxID=1172621 RepID=A0A841APH4_9MICO|nr:hypothetical protein [Conyzicola lurida]MBB5843319.1 hypothetical protein [Conyzicola lurida]
MNDESPKTTEVKGKFRPPTDGSTLPSLTFALTNEEARAGAPEDVVAEFMKTWAPPGASSWYSMKINETPGNGRQSIEASLVVPSANKWELGEARISRIGGRAPSDVDFRNLLYTRIGASAVAGGRIEAAMKRLILHMSGTLEPAFADAEDQWLTLEKKLRAAAMAVGERAADVIEVLDWGQANKIREIRNDMIHAYWWDYSNVGITRGRVHRDGTSEVILMTPEQLDSDCGKLQNYAEALDSAMDGIWLNIYLPRLNDEPTA